jgi:hypothetical protein
MFTRIAPQKVQHNSGYIVQTGGRYCLQYLDGGMEAEVQADFAPTTGIYPDSLTIRDNEGSTPRPASSEERKMIMGRIEAALKFLGEEYEICKGTI